MHTCFSLSRVEFEVWEMQFEAAESRTADKDVYQRRDTFILSKHRKIQQDLLGGSLVARLQPWFVALYQELSSRVQTSGWWVLKGAAQRFLSAQGVQRTSPAGTCLWYLSGKSWGEEEGLGGRLVWSCGSLCKSWPSNELI